MMVIVSAGKTGSQDRLVGLKRGRMGGQPNMPCLDQRVLAVAEGPGVASCGEKGEQTAQDGKL